MLARYAQWMGGILLRGDFGDSFIYETSVASIIWDRLGVTFLLTLSSLSFTWSVAIPIWIYSATHLYSKTDTFFTLLSFIGLATPNFFLALVAMFVQANVLEAASIGGSSSFVSSAAPWSSSAVLFSLSEVSDEDPPLKTCSSVLWVRSMR